MRNPESNEPNSKSKHPGETRDQGPARLAKLLLPKMGRSGAGASSAMAQIRQDRLTAAKIEWTAEDQIKDLWRASPAGQRNFADVRELQAWLTANAPELLPPGDDSHAYLMRLLGGELDK